VTASWDSRVMKVPLLICSIFLVLGVVDAGRLLPAGAVIAGYTNQANASTILKSVDEGANVLIWSFIELQHGKVTDDPAQGGPRASDVAVVMTGLSSRNLSDSIVHLISIGGWDAPHPTVELTGTQWWSTWKLWNTAFTTQVLASGGSSWSGFDGVDLDVEGANNSTSSDNHFSELLLELCGTFSMAAKQDGYLSTMVPPQSYLDCGSSAYDRAGAVTHADSWKPDFTYHGQNTYASLLAKWGWSYDLVMVQVYEGWSRAGNEILGKEMDPTVYLSSLAQCYTTGWDVDFGGAMGIKPSQHRIQVPPHKLVLGLSNGWAAPPSSLARKMLYVDGDSAGKAFQKVGGTKGLRGFAYWDIADDSDRISLVPKLAKYASPLTPPAPTSVPKCTEAGQDQLCKLACESTCREFPHGFKAAGCGDDKYCMNPPAWAKGSVCECT